MPRCGPGFGTAVAFFSASASLMLFRDEADAHPEDLRAIFLEIADDLTRL